MADNLHQRIFENLSTAVLLLDAELRLAAVNPAGETLFELSARHLLGQALAALLPRNEAFVAGLARALAAGHPLTEREVRLVLPGGRAATVDCMVTPLAEDNAARGLLVELNQVDRLLWLAREGNMLDQQAATRSVIRGLAHEIKNPLGGLRGAAQLLARQLHDVALKEYTQVIVQEADRLRDLVDRIVGPNQPLRKGATNIHELFERVRGLILAENPGAFDVETEYDPSLPEAAVDPNQIMQALLNVVRNAAQAVLASGDGDDMLTRRGVIRLRTRAERQFTIGQKRHRLVLRADVEDNGPGIPEDLREQIFYPMVTGRPEGTGLGLSIAQDIVLRHGGIIEFSSRPGQTVFSIYLPFENGHGD